MHREPQPVKLYTIASIYRYAAPQRGRYREHWQLSVEAIGSGDPSLDAELIQLYHELLRRLGLLQLPEALPVEVVARIEGHRALGMRATRPGRRSAPTTSPSSCSTPGSTRARARTR